MDLSFGNLKVAAAHLQYCRCIAQGPGPVGDDDDDDNEQDDTGDLDFSGQAPTSPGTDGGDEDVASF